LNRDLRDVLIHEYFNVRIMRVWYVVANDLQPLKQAITHARTSLDN